MAKRITSTVNGETTTTARPALDKSKTTAQPIESLKTLAGVSTLENTPTKKQARIENKISADKLKELMLEEMKIGRVMEKCHEYATKHGISFRFFEHTESKTAALIEFMKTDEAFRRRINQETYYQVQIVSKQTILKGREKVTSDKVLKSGAKLESEPTVAEVSTFLANYRKEYRLATQGTVMKNAVASVKEAKYEARFSPEFIQQVLGRLFVKFCGINETSINNKVSMSDSLVVLAKRISLS